MTSGNENPHKPVMTVTAFRRPVRENGTQDIGGFTVTNRLAFQNPAFGCSVADQRRRVDPRKLLDLINRIKSASGAEAPVLQHPKPVANAG